MLDNETATAVATTEENGTVLAASIEADAQLEAALAKADKLDDAKVGYYTNVEYFEFKNVGEKVRGVFLGFMELEKNTPAGKITLDGVKWLGKDRQVRVNAGASLFAEFVKENILPNTMVEIEYKGTEKTKAGQDVNVFKIALLVG